MSVKFISDTNFKENLDNLASFSLADVTSTRCMTEGAYQKLPALRVSNGTLREVTILGAAATLLAAPFVFIASKIYNLGVAALEKCQVELFPEDFFAGVSQCFENLTKNILSPVNVMSYLCFASLTGLAGIGAYAGLRKIFEDKTQAERFELLDKAYLGTAQFIEQCNDRGKVRQIVQNLDLIKANLKQVADLTDAQVEALTVKISHAAKVSEHG